jgi:formylglycine-generating enzyme required for sulfatase activity
MQTNTLGMRLFRVPPGSFPMGGSLGAGAPRDDERAHWVRLTRPYWISEREVTIEQYFRIMPRNPAVFDTTVPHDPRVPVTRVSWDDAMKFCRKLSESEGKTYRLPTEAEWEYACRAGTNSAWAGDGNADRMAWHQGNSSGLPHPTGTKGWNHWGLYDMHGNVAEWCLDQYVSDYPQTPDDPLVTLPDPRAPRVVRGGSFATLPALVRSTARDFLSPGTTRSDVGFRVVLEEPPPPAATSRPAAGQ